MAHHPVADLARNGAAQIHDVPAHKLPRSHRVGDSVQTDAVARVEATPVLNLADVDEKTLVGLVSLAKTEALGAVGGNNSSHMIVLKNYYLARYCNPARGSLLKLFNDGAALLLQNSTAAWGEPVTSLARGPLWCLKCLYVETISRGPGTFPGALLLPEGFLRCPPNLGIN